PPENPEARSRKKLGRKLNQGGAGALPSRAGRRPGSSGRPLVSETTDEDAFSLRRGSPCPSLGAGARAVRRRRPELRRPVRQLSAIAGLLGRLRLLCAARLRPTGIFGRLLRRRELHGAPAPHRPLGPGVPAPR